MPRWSHPILVVCAVAATAGLLVGLFQINSTIARNAVKDRITRTLFESELSSKMDRLRSTTESTADNVDRILHGKGPEPLSLKPTK